MFANLQIDDVLFLDIETVPLAPSLEKLDETMQKLWDKKSRNFRLPDQTAADVYERAGIYSEFGKIICISVGFIKTKDPFSIRLKSFYNDDEKLLLKDFSAMLQKFSSSKREAVLCAHNGKEFDFPYIARRMIINSLQIPGLLDNAGKKPWEVRHLDTMDLWKFGDHKNFTSLELLATVLGIESPKDDIDGSMVASVYWANNDLDRIVRYCERDVITIARILLRLMNLPGIADDSIESVTQI
ncbi:MAG TPA: 3'-5' exonuclease [Bacteroidales bacterium]|nr:3'-5' exonuclease [Bacteroidales bacterium]HPF03462.1 3'-5' exonuclease [Bacteroidales bacterium]HPJ60406.1 3'-5' exonuclease [Bacteroidales bacterium]HPR12734.1 3'-5' exonuclease [Bacteroidales bacterium]HRW85604.1 3'-5' exonuclease [Bacteroidales bacterium]